MEDIKEGMIVLAISYYMGERTGRRISKITRVTKAQFEVEGFGKFWLKNMEEVGRKETFNTTYTTIQIITEEERKQLSEEFKRNNRIKQLKQDIPKIISGMQDLEKLEAVYKLLKD